MNLSSVSNPTFRRDPEQVRADKYKKDLEAWGQLLANSNAQHKPLSLFIACMTALQAMGRPIFIKPTEVEPTYYTRTVLRDFISLTLSFCHAELSWENPQKAQIEERYLRVAKTCGLFSSVLRLELWYKKTNHIYTVSKSGSFPKISMSAINMLNTTKA